MQRDPYATYLSAAGVAVAWIGAALGPLFVLVGLIDESRVHLLIGCVALLVVAVSLYEGVRAAKGGVASEWVARLLMPLVLLAGGLVLAWAGSAGLV